MLSTTNMMAISSSLLLVSLVLLLLLHSTLANELSRCCAGGSRHFHEHGNCQSVRAVGSLPTCSRAASICCLRAVIESSCQAGLVYGQRHKVCSTVIINELAGGVKRECCDCCLLAKELGERGEECIAPTGFSPDCLNSFNKCCNRTGPSRHGASSGSASSAHPGDVSIPIGIADGEGGGGGGTGCESASCEHLCTIREDGTAQCSCRSGFDLAPDGRSCVDIDECQVLREHWSSGSGTHQALLRLLPTIFRGMPLCDPRKEVCVNTEGGYGCRPAASSTGFGAATKSSPNSGVNRPPFGRRKSVVNVKANLLEHRKTTAAKNGGKKVPPVASTEGANAADRFVYQRVEEKMAAEMAQEKATALRREKTAKGAAKGKAAMAGEKIAAMGRERVVAMNRAFDVDECTLGAHDCGSMYQCKNTQGSFRCVPKKCADDEALDPASGECKSINCPVGYRASEGRCEDIDECKRQPMPCPAYEECVNTPGGFRCQEQGNVCSPGYYMDTGSGFCLDIDECQRGTHSCGANGECINLPATFRCNCAAGFEFNEYTMRCEDIDECVKFAGHACSLQADCVNSVGSFHCICKPGFRLAADNRSCDDIDECAMGIARCQQKCINSPGSYQCICDRGYQLGLDESTCEDIDECAIWAKSGNELCMGECSNTPGSFVCNCPVGYEIMADGITCKDVDECAGQPNLCPGEQLCINLLGSYRCQRIECPRNYLPDRQYKNRCVKRPGFCENFIVERCKKYAVHISWQHIAIPKQINISLHRTSVTLFSMKGPSNPNSTMQFELRLVSARPDFHLVSPAVRANFLLQKGDDHNSATIALRDSLDGPQEVHLELVLRLTTNGIFNGKYLANLMVYVSQYRPQAQHDRHHRHHRNRRFTI